MAAPTCCTRSGFQLAPRQAPHGKQAAVTPPANIPPCVLFGPSLTLIAGTFSLGMGVVCQKSLPASSAIFSSRLS